MKRFLLTTAAAAALAGPAAAQKADPADVMTMRTAGQPERKLKILKVDRGADGVTLTTVKDIATGETYTLTDRPAGTQPPAASPMPDTPAPKPLPATVPPTGTMTTTTTPPATKSVAARVFGGRTPPPVAKERTADPLGGTPPVGVAASRGKAGTYDNNPVPNPADPKPGLFTRMFGGKPVPAAGQQVYSPAPKAAAMPAMPTPAPARLTPPAPRPAVVPVPQPAPAPTIVPSSAQMPIPTPPAAVQIPAVTAPAAPQAVQAPSGKIEITMPVGVIPAEVRLKEETADAVKNLQGHARPSIRMEAATELADGRYGSREEVKQLLAQCAKSDSAGVVRGHCISCLSRLGYADPAYLQELQTWAASDEPAVRRAATAALEKFMPKK